jgi:hypothetical protein
LALLGVAVAKLSSHSGPGEPFGWLAAFFGGVFAPVLLVRNAFPRAKATTIRATEEGVSIEGHSDIRSEDILEAKVVPRRGSDSIVELALRTKKTVALRMNALEANALVQLLGARRTRFRLVASYAARFAAALGAFTVLATIVARGNMETFLILMVPSSLFWGAIIAWLIGYVRGRLTIGADGLTTRWLWRERFIAFREVAAVIGRRRLLSHGIEDTLVERRSGRTMRLRTVEAPNTEEERGGESRAMLGHLSAAFHQSARVLDGRVDLPSLVERGSRSAREWLSSIDALVRGGGSRYRVAAVSPEMLTRVATDPSASIESRVGAAAALVRIGDEALRMRVRISAEGCAETELRDTLLALSEARDDASTEAALARLSR